MPKRVTISVSDDLYEYFKTKATNRGISMSAIISSALHEYVKQETMIEQMKSDEWQSAMKTFNKID